MTVSQLSYARNYASGNQATMTAAANHGSTLKQTTIVMRGKYLVQGKSGFFFALDLIAC